MVEKSSDGRQRISLDLTRELVAHLDHLRREWGIRSRGDVLERLLDDLFGSGDDGDGEREAEGDGEGDLVAVSSLPPLYHPLFPWKYFNRIQSDCFQLVRVTHTH